MVLVRTLHEITLFSDVEYERYVDRGWLHDACELFYFFEEVT